MFQNITDKYTGADATGEILVMLAGAFILGWVLRWLYDQVIYDYEDDMFIESGQGATAPVVEAAPAPVASAVMPYKQDDLKIIEGVGPKIEQLLHEGGITTWQGLADSNTEDIKTILRSAGERYRIHDPSTWSEQAGMAAAHKWDELEEFQDFLSGGKIVG